MNNSQDQLGSPHVSPQVNFDADSAFSSSDISTTRTADSSIFRYRHENGRSYHAYKDGKYMFPNDELETNRSQLEHQLWLLTLGDQLALSPIGDQVHRVLDVGTGGGHWAIDFADLYPAAEVIGVDLSPVQPAFVPANCKFEIDDVDEDWTYGHKFSFIHTRMMNQALESWPRFFQQSFDNLESGGHLELQECHIPCRSDDGTLPQFSVLNRWCSMMLECGRRLDRDGSVVPHARALMEKAGFVDVVETEYKWPTNRWPEDQHLKELGQWNEANQELGLEAASLAFFTRVLGWSVEQLKGFLVELMACVNDRNIHAYWPIHVIHGRKP